MGYIEKNLMQNERVVYKAQLHYVVYWLPALCILLALILAFIPTEEVNYLARAATAGIVIVGSLLWCVAINNGKQYVVTTRRLIFKRGIVKRESLELLLRKCEGVKIEQSVMGRLLGYGTVVVTTGEATNRYEHIKSPLTFSTQINQQIDNLRDDT